MSARLLVGQVMHRRLHPTENAFVYPVFYGQFDLAALESAGNAVFSVNRFNWLGLHAKDHGPRDGSPLLPWIQDLLARHGLPADGKVILQCFPRVLGYVFNPVSFWFCHDRAERLVAVLAEVNNTFGEHHLYLLHHPDGSPIRDGEVLHAAKAFHVSPFFDVTGSYRFRFHLSARRPLVRIDYSDTRGDLLHTAISGEPRPWTAWQLLKISLCMPFLSLRIWARIHRQAWRIWRKGMPFYSKPPAPLKEPV